MSKRKQEEVTQEISSAETAGTKETETPAPKKQKEKLPDGGVVSLGSNKFVTVTEFRGKVYVGIREYYEKDGELKPGKKGIALNLEQWNLLKDVFFFFLFFSSFFFFFSLLLLLLFNFLLF